MLNLPPVTVIVPVHNAERSLPRLVHSLRGQSYPAERVRIVMVDNMSTDGSAEVIGRYPEVTLLKQTEYQSPAAARNTGILEADTAFLAFIDADIWARPDWLAKGMRRMLAGGADMVAGRVEFVTSPRPNLYEIYESNIDFRQPDYIAEGWAGTGNLFVRRSVFDEVGLFEWNLRSSEDAEFGLRATRAGKALAYEPDAVVYHRARSTLWALVKKWMRTEYGAAQAYRQRGLFELHLWCKKANYRPLAGTWRAFPEEVTRNPRRRIELDLLANILRYAGNAGNFLGYFSVGTRRRAERPTDGACGGQRQEVSP